MKKAEITRLRDLMVPMFNYIELIKSKGQVTKQSVSGFNNVVEHELSRMIENTSEIRKILTK